MEEREVPYIKELYEASFPKSEKKPFEAMVEGSERMYAVVEEGRACGLLFTLEDANHILIDYFAVDPQARKRQIGSRVLQQFFAAHDKPIVLEIEDPWSTEAPAERALRQRRKAFYLRNGMREQAYNVDLFGVRMEMLATVETFSFEAYLSLLKTCLFDGVERYVALAEKTTRES